MLAAHWLDTSTGNWLMVMVKLPLYNISWGSFLTQMQFNINTLNLFLTYPQCDLNPDDVLTFFRGIFGDDTIEYACVSSERHEATEGLHVHAIIMLRRRFRSRNCHCLDIREFHGQYKSVLRGDCERVLAYVKKNGNWVEHGDRPMDKKKMKVKEKNRLIRDTGIGELIDAGEVNILSTATVMKAQNILKLVRKIEDLPYSERKRNLWIFGPTGCGKSLWVREHFPAQNLYWKPISKWWDGYADEAAVVLDDVGQEHSFLGYFLKIWMDRYVFTGETKGGQFKLRPEYVIVTSNYRPEDVFGRRTSDGWEVDEITCSALRRRMDVVSVREGVLRTEVLDLWCDWEPPLIMNLQPTDDGLVTGTQDP